MVADLVVSDRDLGMVGMSLLQAYFTDNMCVCDVMATCSRVIVVVDGVEGVGNMHRTFPGCLYCLSVFIVGISDRECTC